MIGAMTAAWSRGSAGALRPPSWPMSSKWKIEKTTTVHGPAVGRTFSNYESARQFVANRVSKGEKEKK